MAAPVLQAEGATATGVTTGVPSVTIPTHQADDILIVVAMAWVPNTTTPDAAQIPTPSTWNLLGTQIGQPAASPRDGWVGVFWKRATGAGTTVTLTRGSGWDTGADTCYNARAYVIRNVKTSGDPHSYTANSGPHTTANQNIPALTITGEERLAMIFGAMSDNLAFAMTSSPWTAGTEDNDNGGTDSSFQCLRQDNINTSTGAQAATVTQPTGFYGYVGVVFQPAKITCAGTVANVVSLTGSASVYKGLTGAVACTCTLTANLSPLARNFTALTTDLLSSESPLTITQLTSIYFRFNLTSHPAVGARFFSWAGLEILDANDVNIVLQFHTVLWTGGTGLWDFPTPSTGAEHDLLVTYDAGDVNNLPVAFLDGSPVTVNLTTAPIGPSAFTADTVCIGNRATPNRPLDGWMSTVGIWQDILLGQTEATALTGGAAPCAIQSDNLVAYWPMELGEDPEPDLISANDLTVSGTTIVSGSQILHNPRCASAAGPVALEGTLALVSTFSANQTSTKPLSGSLTLVSAVSAFSASTKPIDGNLAMVASLSAALSQVHGMTGTVDVVTTLSSSLSATKPLTASVTNVFSLTADLTIQGSVPLVGTIALVSAVSGSLQATTPLSGSMQVACTLSADVAIASGLAGNLTTALTATAALTVTAGGGGANIQLVQSKDGTATNFSETTISFNSDVVAGDLLVCTGGLWTGGTTQTMGVTSDRSAAFTVQMGPAGLERAWIAYAVATSSGACTLTLTPSAGGAYAAYTIAEFSGIDSTPLDVDGGTSTGTGTTASDSLDTSANDTLVVGVMSHFDYTSQTLTEDTGGGWTLLGEYENSGAVSNYNAQYQIFSSAGTKTASWTIGNSVDWGAQTASFKASVGAGQSVALDGTMAIVSGCSANLSAAKPISGTVDLVSTLTVNASVTKGITASLDVVVTLAGVASLTKNVTGSLTAAFSVSADLSIQGSVTLAGSINVVSSVSGSVQAAKLVTGSVNVVSTVAGSTQAAKLLTSSVNVISSVSANTQVARGVTGSMDLISTLLANANVTKKLTGSVGLIFNLNSDLTIQGQVVLAGTIDAAVSINAALSVTKPLTGSLGLMSTVNADFAPFPRALVGNISAVSQLTAALLLTKGCQGFILCTTSIGGSLQVARGLVGSLDVISDLSGWLGVRGIVGEPYRILAVMDRHELFDVTERVEALLASERDLILDAEEKARLFEAEMRTFTFASTKED